MTVRRLKTYTGAQGYVYQYYFVGKRPAISAVSASTEYVFDVTSDRKTTFAVSVFLPDEAMRAWAEKHGRPLADAEQYGAVKMRLFEAFDQVEDMMGHGRELKLDAESLDRLTAALGVQ